MKVTVRRRIPQPIRTDGERKNEGSCGQGKEKKIGFTGQNLTASQKSLGKRKCGGENDGKTATRKNQVMTM